MLHRIYKVTLALGISLFAMASNAQSQSNVTLVKEYWCEKMLGMYHQVGSGERKLFPTRECGGGRLNFFQPVAHKVTLQIRTSGNDAGMPGGYYIGLVQGYYLVGGFSSVPVQNWNSTRAGETRMQINMGGTGLWMDYIGGLMEPAWEQRPLGNQATFVLVDGQDLCAVATRPRTDDGIQPVETYQLYAGYGVVTPMEEQQAQIMAANADPKKPRPSDDPMYMHRTYAQRDMKHNEKFWKVTDVTCPSNDLWVPDSAPGS